MQNANPYWGQRLPALHLVDPSTVVHVAVYDESSLVDDRKLIGQWIITAKARHRRLALWLLVACAS